MATSGKATTFPFSTQFNVTQILLEIKKPRCPSRLVYRSSFKDCTDKDYFKYSVRHPYLDSIIAEFATKFSKKSLSAYKLISVLLSSNVDVSDGLTVFKMYGRLIHNQEQALLEELKAFSEYRVKNFPDEQKLTKLLLDTPARFESVRKLLQIALTLPVTSCEAEMSFSAMEILKNRLRSTMVDERLNGLAHKYIHKDIDFDPEAVIDNFARCLSKK